MAGHGIDVHVAMEWLFDMLLGGATPRRPPGPPSSDPGDFGGGTPNMKLLYAVCAFIYAVLTKAADTATHRERLRRILTRERQCHGQGEPTSSSHGQLWLAGFGATLMISEKAKDDLLLALAIEWLAAQHAIHAVTRDETNAMWCPGGRGLQDPKGEKVQTPAGSNPTTARMWEAITTGKPHGHPNQYDVGAWCVAGCSTFARQRIQQRPLQQPPMAGVFHARRYDNGDFVAWYESLDGCLDVTLSAGRIDSEKWVSKLIEVERIASYGKREPIMRLDAPKGVIA